MKSTVYFSWVNLLRQKIIFRSFYWALRIGMGLTFILSGTRKLPGVKFTILSVDNPVGAYFHAMYETGFYWLFPNSHRLSYLFQSIRIPIITVNDACNNKYFFNLDCIEYERHSDYNQSNGIGKPISITLAL